MADEKPSPRIVQIIPAGDWCEVSSTRRDGTTRWIADPLLGIALLEDPATGERWVAGLDTDGTPVTGDWLQRPKAAANQGTRSDLDGTSGSPEPKVHVDDVVVVS